MEKTPEREPTKPTKWGFDGFDGRPYSHFQIMRAFRRWLVERCARRKGAEDWGYLGLLHVDFCEWLAESESGTGCTRREFEDLVSAEGFTIKDGFVLGLVCLEDIESLALFENGQNTNHQNLQNPTSAPRMEEM